MIGQKNFGAIRYGVIESLDLPLVADFAAWKLTQQIPRNWQNFPAMQFREIFQLSSLKIVPENGKQLLLPFRLFRSFCWSECNLEFRIGYDNVCKASAGSTMVTSVEIVMYMELFCYKAYFFTAWWLPQKGVSHKEASKWALSDSRLHNKEFLNSPS